MKLALGLDVQTNAKGGKFMSIEDSRQGALVCKADVEVLWEPGNFQDDGAKRVGVCFASNTDLELWTEEVEQSVIDNMIIFQKPFPGAARTELESQLQRAVKVSAKGKHVKCKMDLERCLFWGPAGNRVPRPTEFARRRGRALVEARHVWLMGRQWGVLFEVRRLMLEPLEAPLPVLGLQQLGAWADGRHLRAGPRGAGEAGLCGQRADFAGAVRRLPQREDAEGERAAHEFGEPRGPRRHGVRPEPQAASSSF